MDAGKEAGHRSKKYLIYLKGGPMLKKYAAGICIPILLICVAFLSGCHRPAPDQMAERITEKLKTKLELNAAQQQELDGIKEEFKKKMAEMKKNHASRKEEFLTLIQSDAIDGEKLKKMHNEKKAGIEEFSSMMIDKLVKFHSTLTPEQKKLLVKYMRERKGCWN
jgi:Spy/CpxP family protein refolding chaperone